VANAVASDGIRAAEAGARTAAEAGVEAAAEKGPEAAAPMVEPTRPDKVVVAAAATDKAAVAAAAKARALVARDGFRPRFVNVISEPEEAASCDHELKLLKEYEAVHGAVDGMVSAGVGRDGFAPEEYEETISKHGDVAFTRFTERIARCKTQFLRYCRGGAALVVTDNAKPLPTGTAGPPCEHCGGPTAFELQLLSTMLNFLKLEDSAADEDRETSEPVTFRCTFGNMLPGDWDSTIILGSEIQV